MQNCFEHTCSDGGIQLSIDAKKMFGAQEKTIKYERIVLFVWKDKIRAKKIRCQNY